ncbi:MAG: cytochrome c3 family protein [Bacillota bacterium]|nr:cytochrome c3 family protein [Bacillota bacterium]
MKRILALVATGLLVILLASTTVLAVAGAIANTKHNLATSGPNADAKSTDEDEICVFCHTPHNARVAVPLWNRDASPATYTTYTSSTIDGTRDTITGSSPNISVLCLSCHDGAISLGAVVNNYPDATDPTITGSHTTAGKLSSGRALLGIDLTNDHPIAITYNTTPGDLVAPDANGLVASTCQLFKTGGTGEWKVECASCHSVHNNTYAPFLRASNAGSALCLKCHIK